MASGIMCHQGRLGKDPSPPMASGPHAAPVAALCPSRPMVVYATPKGRSKEGVKTLGEQRKPNQQGPEVKAKRKRRGAGTGQKEQFLGRAQASATWPAVPPAAWMGRGKTRRERMALACLLVRIVLLSSVLPLFLQLFFLQKE